MNVIVVRTQAELDAALAEHRDNPDVVIRIASKDRLIVAYSGECSVRAVDSATVTAYDSATVHAWDSATVHALDSATVHAGGSATVRAGDSATVYAGGSATVHAGGSATVHAGGSATVYAGKYVAVHRNSPRATVNGGVVIDTSGINISDPTAWCAYHNIETRDDGRVVLYKAVDQNLVAGHGRIPTTYPVGKTVEATDWIDNTMCGNGLHLSPTPAQAYEYFTGTGRPRYLRCLVDVALLRPIEDKAKAPAVFVEAEVDINGKDLEDEE